MVQLTPGAAASLASQVITAPSSFSASAMETASYGVTFLRSCHLRSRSGASGMRRMGKPARCRDARGLGSLVRRHVVGQPGYASHLGEPFRHKDVQRLVACRRTLGESRVDLVGYVAQVHPPHGAIVAPRSSGRPPVHVRQATIHPAFSSPHTHTHTTPHHTTPHPRSNPGWISPCE